MGLRDDELAGIRQTISDWLPDTCTITRTGQTVPCKLRDDGREVHIEGLPRFLPLRRWRIKMPDGTDVQPWDELTIPSKGTYLATVSANPTSYSLSTVVFAVKSAPATIASTMRDPSVVNDVASGAIESLHLRRLVLRSVGDTLYQPMSQQLMADTFNVTVAQAYRVFAMWPQPNDWVDPSLSVEPYPVAQDDTILLPNGQQYVARFIELYAPVFMALYLEIPETS